MDPLQRPRRATIGDVAKAAGVSRAIVSRVLRDDPVVRVRPATRERILRSARLLDYVPNHAARALRLSVSGALGLILHDVTNPVFAQILRGAEEAAARAGYLVLLANAEDLARNGDAFSRLLREQRIDGTLFQASGSEDGETMQRIVAEGVPSVLINGQSSPLPGSVALDDVGAGRVAARHLIDLGHRRVGLLAGTPDSTRGRRRHQGVALELGAAGLELPPRWALSAGWDENEGQAAMRRLLERRDRPTGVVVANVMAALGALGAARDAGVRVPGDLSIVAIHDTRMAELTTPTLTAVRLPLEVMASTAVELLLRLIAGGPPESIVVTEPRPELIPRGSTAAP